MFVTLLVEAPVETELPIKFVIPEIERSELLDELMDKMLRDYINSLREEEQSRQESDM